MKKFLAGLIVLFMLAVTLPIAADAQSCGRGKKKGHYKTAGYNNSRYYANNERSYGRYQQRPSFYRRHRNFINIGVGAGAGTLIGAIVGGKRGALAGGLLGAGGAALYSYGIKKKKRAYYR